ncbi:piggyBac transposable element-derived protein 4-like [Maniola jurtina]|uniref:piggyBac transposable element-derived protein 4-like n=1 Tax=Maniola jurtina TaxID=191418 RepID=UPI001E6898B6|nr:piggyBac transposable element-derived protein 4-like [Maniola jurtina]
MESADQNMAAIQPPNIQDQSTNNIHFDPFNLVNYGSELEDTDVENSDADDENDHTHWPRLVRPVYTCSDDEEDYEEEMEQMFEDTGSEEDTSSGSEVDEDRLSKYIYREPYSDSDESLDENDENSSHTETLSGSNTTQKDQFDWKPLKISQNVNTSRPKNSEDHDGKPEEENSQNCNSASSGKDKNDKDIVNTSCGPKNTENHGGKPDIKKDSQNFNDAFSGVVQNVKDKSGPENSEDYDVKPGFKEGNSQNFNEKSSGKDRNEKDLSDSSSKASQSPENESDLEVSSENFQNRREKFDNNNVGPTKAYANPYEAFTAIWDQKIMEHIVTETNRYARQSKIQQWQDTTIDEMYVYFGLIVSTTTIVNDVIKHYWVESLATTGYLYLMPYRRFKELTYCIHFTDNNILNEKINEIDNSQAKLCKLQPLIDHLNEKFSTLYNVGQNVILDEGLTQWKGWIVNTRRICIEPDPVEVKSVEICEPNTGYLWRMQLVPGDITTGMIPGLLTELLKGLEGKGHTIWMDKFYSSPILARQLKQRGFDCAGLVQKSYLPTEVSERVRNIIDDETEKNRNMSEIHGSTSGDVDIFAWITKNRCVNFITTYHGTETVVTNNLKTPKIMLDYNRHTQGVHRKDNLLFKFPMERKNLLFKFLINRKNAKVWYKMFFRKLLNVSVLNAHILYNKRDMKHYDFRKKLCKQILCRHRYKSPSAADPPAGFHVPVSYILMKKQKMNEKRCVSCKNITDCHLCPLCGSPCSSKFHDSDEDDSDEDDSDDF